MNSLSIKLLLICLSFTTICLNIFVDSRKDKIKLKDIQVLTLKPNQWTTGRRSSPVAQLQCVGGYCDAIKGQTVQCYNRGSDGVDVQWECKTQINNNYKFGSINVICEGYDYADDDYVLIGSCGLEYSIDSVDPNQRSQKPFTDNTYTKSKPSNGFSFGFIVCAVFLVFIIYYTCLRRTTPSTSDRRGGSPPPPGFRSDFFGGSDGGSDGCSSSTGSTGYTGSRTNTNANTGNGFFSGLFAGGALGYLFGSRNRTNYRDQSSYFGSRGDRTFYSSGTDTYSGSSGGSSTTTTSGFGGTKRR